MKKILSTLFLLIAGFPSASPAQAVYEIDDVSHLLLYYNSILPLKAYDDGFAKRYIVSLEPFSINESSRHDSEKELEEQGGEVISINELTAVSKAEWINTFLKQEYIVAKDGEKDFQTWEMLLPGLWVERHYKFDKNPYDYQAPPAWNVDAARMFAMNFVALPNGRMYMQDSGSNFIIPRKGGFYAGRGNNGHLSEKLDPAKYDLNNEMHTYQTLANLGAGHLYEIAENSAQKYELRYKYGNGENLLENAYDAIYKSSIFVVGRQGDKYDIYNTLLEEIDEQVDGFNFDAQQVHYVKNSKLHVKNVVGGEGTALQYTRFVCGTVPHWHYKIERSEGGGAQLLGAASDTFLMSTDELEKKAAAGETSAWDDFWFLDGSDELFYDSNSLWFLIENTMGVGPNWLVVEKSGKLGLVEFYDGAEFSTREILPVQFNKIEFKSGYEPLVLYKNGLIQVCIALYNDDNFGQDVEVIISPEFKAILEQHKFYLRYETPDGQQGWYDIQRGLVFMDKWQDRLSNYRSSLQPENP